MSDTLFCRAMARTRHSSLVTTNMFQATDIPRVLPEILLIVLALLILGSDIFERWANTEAARQERARAAGSLAAIGLGMVLAITLLQSGYVYKLPADAGQDGFSNIIRNLQSGGPGGEPIAGAFATDHLTMICRLLLIAAALLTCLLVLDQRPSRSPGELYALILFSTAGMCLMVAATELLTAFLAIELTSIPLYILAGYFHNDRRSAEAGMKYFLFGALSSGILLYGMSLVYGATANTLANNINANDLTQFAQIGSAAEQGSNLLTLGMLFVIAGVGYKLAIVPFHGWAPDVYQGAPTPITAFIATASKVAGFVLLYRLLVVAFPPLAGAVALEDFGGWSSLLAVLAIITLIIGNLAALPQSSAKRLLAYSSIAHAGFVLMALVAWAVPAGLDRSIAPSSLLYYLVVYTLTNLGAFGAVAAVGLAVGGEEIADLSGLARRNLPLAALFAICVLSLAGIPPLAGFFAKFYVFLAAWQAGAWLLVGVGIVTTVISLYYYLRLLRAMFIDPPLSSEPIAVPANTLAALAISAGLLVLIGIFPNTVLFVIDRVNAVAGF
jgi:proton-translocating NADH-quinone oxidoreductase chain N